MIMLRAALLASALALPFTSAIARDLTPEDIARIETTGAVAVSPDGTRIAYTRVHYPDVTTGEDNSGAQQQLFLADAAMQARAFLPEDMNVSTIGFTPDGRTITFLWTGDDGDRALWGIPVDGGSHRKIAGVADARVSAYAFSPDGAQVYMLASAAPDETRDEEAGAGFTSVVYEEEQQLNRVFVANVGSEVDADPVAVTVPGYVDSFTVAPGGDWALITSAPSPLVDDGYTSKRANILNLATGSVLAVATPGKIGDVEISPDGRQLSLVAGTDINDPAPTTLYLVDTATGAMRALNEGAAEAAGDTEWMADGRLATIIDVGVQTRLRFYSAEGQMLEEVDPGELILASLEQGGNRLTVEANAPTFPNELFLYSRGGTFERWTDHNPWLSEIDFGEQRAWTYTARDGTEIEGVLIEPVGGVPAGGAPLILNVHGGPEAHDSNGWSTNYSSPGHVAAGEGYAVFRPNYRGSTAYGSAFSRQHQGDAAGVEFDDLVDAKRALVAAGIADADRVGVTGGSYGGYATAWSATRYSEEFAAGVMFVGISNILSKWGTTDIPGEEYNVHARRYVWDEYEQTLQRSPIYWADQAETPLLIMHGANDPRVSPTQSYELYRHIKVRKPETPVRLVLYPGEGHGNAQAAARYDYNLRMMEWFDTYLMTGDRDAAMPGPRPDLGLGESEEG
ncbi:prolyl oligopeptidase family serine peptidase [Erythrobacter arachoides]|uniref:Prolyl oligopeptidase family serine peptidase n=1 Tax=Aurantiacibacter arachoides TaxID=1850444 RepID=A0A845A3K0_9SPHN|nr:S9 family peptidase [Aurantiacibacter arachoides]MXO94002.1 prolyl oligopeptidase family serine peptidase [Aurantiacibacter arachoides]GGD44886.1 peptidase [Aurantiacibacter arachoides]